MRLVLASQNAHKARELAAVLEGWQVEPLGAELPDELGATFLENAREKARFGRAHTDPDAWVAGEDSGLEVEALGGRPGIRSARYAGVGAKDAENVEKLLAEVAGVPDDERGARYVCELVVLAPDGRELRARGTLEGAIARVPRGEAGFGYDPVFVPSGETRSVAELGNGWKRVHSHRARAARALAGSLGAEGAAL